MNNQPKQQLSEKVLETLKQKQIHPTPKWHFLLRDSVMWCLFVAIIAIGALAVSVMLFILTDSDWDIHTYLNRSALEHALLSLPYIWIAIILLLITLSIVYFEHTKKGYQHKILTVVTTNIGASVVLGALFFYGGFGLKLNTIFYNTISGYQHLVPQHTIDWIKPERGMLAGQIYKNQLPAELILIDFSNNRWIVSVDNLPRRTEALLRPSTTIKIIGSQVSTSTFHAIHIRPWYKSLKPHHKSPVY